VKSVFPGNENSLACHVSQVWWDGPEIQFMIHYIFYKNMNPYQIRLFMEFWWWNCELAHPVVE